MVGKNGSLNFLSKIFSVVAATAMTVSAAYAGGVERSIALDPEHIALGQSYLLGSGALQSTGGAAVALTTTSSDYPGLVVAGSAVMISDVWGLTAWHVIGPWAGFHDVVHQISTGLNFNSDPGEVRHIVEVVPFPGSQFNNPEAPDLCLFRVDAPIQGIVKAEFGIASEGDILTMAGFGAFGSQATGSFPPDGNVRGMRAPVQGVVVDFYNPDYYQQTVVYSASTLPLLGRALGGDSGAGIFDSLGRLAGITKASTLGTTFTGQTTFMKMTDEVQGWIAATARASCAADFNNDGFIDFFDYSEYVECFDTGVCNEGKTADFNADGFTDFFDYDDMVQALERGC